MSSETMPTGFFEDLLTKGGRRLHAFALLLAIPVMCACCLILTIAAARGKSLQVELLSAYGTLTGLVGYVYRKGKEADAAAPGGTHA